MSLQAQLDAFKAAFRAGNPPYRVTPAMIAVMDRATQSLVDSGAARLALRAGDPAPAFELEDADGVRVRSRDLLGKGALIVSFYRGVWCPYCNMELQALQQAVETFRSHGASLVALSPQSRPNSRKSMRQNGLDFPILSDPGNEVAARFGVTFSLPGDLVDLYKTLGNDLPAINGDPSWTLPMPSRFVIGPDGIIRYAEVNPDYTQRPEPLDLLPSLVAMRTRAA